MSSASGPQWPDAVNNAGSDLAELVVTQELLLHWITAIYAVCNVVRLLFYVPQLLAVVRDPLGACAISLSTWIFWTFSHAVTTVYCGMVVSDPLLAAMMLGNTIGSLAVVALTARKRYAYGKSRRALITGGNMFADVDEPSRSPMSTRLRPLFHAAIAIAFALAPSFTMAQPYPSKPIRLIVPLAPGSTADIASRFTANELGKVLGQTVVVENKTGAGGTIAMAELARSAPDGYTIGFASQGTLVFNQGIYAKPGYDSTKDFAPIALLGGVSNVMIVHPTNKASGPADVIAVAKAKPGESTFSSGGAGTSHHLSGVLFGRVTATELVHVPYKGAPQGVLAVMANEVTMGFFNTPTVISQIKDGKVKALGVTSLARSPLLPNVPTLDEQGVKGYEVNTWFGFVAPAGTPPEVVSRLNAELNKIFASAEAKEKLAPQGFDLSPPLTPAAFGKLIADDLTRWVPIVKASGAKAD